MSGKMKYFCTEDERIGTCYHEFYRGKFDGVSFWRSDSMLLHDDLLGKYGLDIFFNEVIPNYDPLGEVEIDYAQWNLICSTADAYGGAVREIIDELWVWAENTFRDNDVFTILGI